MEVTTIRLYRVTSWDARPFADPSGTSILPESILEVVHTGERFRWTGSDWQLLQGRQEWLLERLIKLTEEHLAVARGTGQLTEEIVEAIG